METTRKLPTINVRGAKVALGPFTLEHYETYIGYTQDPEIAIYGNGSLDIRVPDPAAFKEPPKDKVYFTVFEAENLNMIGETVLSEIDHRHNTATFGITIGDKNYWGRGYGTEATKLTLDYAFRFLNLHNVSLITASFNVRAQEAYRKAGFKEIGRRRGSLLLNKQRYDDILMDCVASEFESPVPGWFSL